MSIFIDYFTVIAWVFLIVGLFVLAIGIMETDGDSVLSGLFLLVMTIPWLALVYV